MTEIKRLGEFEYELNNGDWNVHIRKEGDQWIADEFDGEEHVSSESYSSLEQALEDLMNRSE